MTVEHVEMKHYRVYQTVASKLGLSEQTEEVGFRCPRCDFLNPVLEHGHRSQCPNCELYFELWGNGLDCSDEPFPDGPPAWMGRHTIALDRLIEQERKAGFWHRVRSFFAH